MSDATFDDLRLYAIPQTDDPVIRARRTAIAKWAIHTSPEAREELREELVRETRIQDARTALRHVLAARRLALSPENEARIDACTDVDTLRRWHDQAVVAAHAADALR